MKRNSPPTVLFLPLLIALLGVGFCAWSASGNALELCSTVGCSLYQDAAIEGISVWWLGTAAFGLLSLVALLGRPWLGVLAGGACLLADALLLLLMLFTAPCVSCLVAGLLFALFYAGVFLRRQRDTRISRSRLLLAWGMLFIINLSLTARTESGVWALAGPDDATVRVYFSPSCSACREAVTALSGRPNVAFHPVAENDGDVPVIVAMLSAVRNGMAPAQALAEAKPPAFPAFLDRYSLEMLLLRFRLLRNKAHVLASGGQAVPFIEYQGLPASLKPPQPPRAGMTPNALEPHNPEASLQDATLPVDGDIAGSCGTGQSEPCP